MPDALRRATVIAGQYKQPTPEDIAWTLIILSVVAFLCAHA